MKHEQRQQWPSRVAFIMASCGSAVGLGNLLRYSSKAWENYGVQWFIPYVLALLFIGVPLLLVEISIGQAYRSTNVVALGRINHRFRGLGFATILNAYIVATYYNVLIGWILVYFGYSFVPGELQWKEDPEKFLNEVVAQQAGATFESSENQIIWQTFGLCFATWVFVYFCIFRGVNVLGRVVYFTMGVPIVMLFVILIRGLTLERAADGIFYYIQAWRPEALSEAQVWQAAVGQIFFSIGCSFGVFTTYASYNPRMQNAVVDSLIISFSNSIFEFIAGFAAFAVTGFLNLDPASKAKLGSFELGFLSYPTALAQLPGARYWSIVFFCTLFLLGMDSAFSLVEGIVTLVEDSHYFGSRLSRPSISALVCGAGVLFSFIYSSDIGEAYLGAVDKYTNEFGLPFIAFAECFLIGFVYRYKDVIGQVGGVSYCLSVFGYLGGVVSGVLVGYFVEGDHTTAGFVTGVVVWVVSMYLSYVFADKPSVHHVGDGACNKLYWILIYQADQLRKDLNVIITKDTSRVKIPIVWSFVLKFVTGPVCLILCTFTFTGINLEGDPIGIFGFICGMLIAFFTVVGLLIPRFFDILLPVGEKDQWKQQFDSGAAVTMVPDFHRIPTSPQFTFGNEADVSMRDVHEEANTSAAKQVENE